MPAIEVLNETLLAHIRPGTWVAISEDQQKVVGTGRTVDEALRQAEENGEKNPFILRIRVRNHALIL